MLGSAAQDDRRRYELLRVVNRGGMGEIALGRVKGTKGFEKLVVLKRLRADAEREDHFQMFDVEQEVMSKIEHPNIVKVFDQPLIESIPYLAMEYVRGRNLDQVLRAALTKGEKLPVNFTLSVVSEVLRGLAFVHRLKDNEGRALGVVHQDMTPSNVMVSFFGEVKITDFGISYVTSRDGGLRKGVLKGKPRYVAPEVLAGKRVNNAADIYGVGVVLFEMLTGQALFARPSVKETLSAVAKNDLPDFKERLGFAGDAVVRIVETATRKDPTERYRTAEAMAAEVLNELKKTGGAMSAPTIGWHVRRYFLDDPDVPEMDPDLEKAIQQQESAPPGMQPADLDETLEALDRLLGPTGESSIDLFDVPEDIAGHLTDMPDVDPFMAATPLPDFVWDAETDAEILERANNALGPDPLSRTAKPLFGDGSEVAESRGVMNKDPLPQFEPPTAQVRSPKPKPEPIAPAEDAPTELKLDGQAPVSYVPTGEQKAVSKDQVAAAKAAVEAKAPATPVAAPRADTPKPVARPAVARTDSAYPVPQQPESKAGAFMGGIVLGVGAGLGIGYYLFVMAAGG